MMNITFSFNPSETHEYMQLSVHIQIRIPPTHPSTLPSPDSPGELSLPLSLLPGPARDVYIGSFPSQPGDVGAPAAWGWETGQG